MGSLIIDAMAAGGAIPFGIGAGLFLAESDGRIAGTLRLAADVLSGVPSIVVAIFAYAVLVAHGIGHFSAVAASFAIGVLMLPVIMRASETAIRGVPTALSEAGLALGARRATIARKVVLPAALPGLITGVLLAVARGAGETAPLLFTAVGSQYFSASPAQADRRHSARRLPERHPGLPGPGEDRLGKCPVPGGDDPRPERRQQAARRTTEESAT